MSESVASPFSLCVYFFILNHSIVNNVTAEPVMLLIIGLFKVFLENL